MFSRSDLNLMAISALLLLVVVLTVALLRTRRRNLRLKQADRHMQALMDAIPELTWVKDTQSRFLFVNAQFGKTFGRQPKSLVGLTDHDLSTPDAAAAYIADDRRVLESGESLQREETITGEGGREAWAETLKVPLFDRKGKVIGNFSSLTKPDSPDLIEAVEQALASKP